MENAGTIEKQDTEEVYESSEGLTLDGEAWKNRNHTTYTSLLDKYEVADLFSNKSMRAYQQLEEDKASQQEELTAYIFSGRMQTQSKEESMVEDIFAEDIQLSRVKDYDREGDDYSICLVMAEILFVLIFIWIFMKINAGRRKRREAYAVEINMEN